jgi:hypothetical protein
MNQMTVLVFLGNQSIILVFLGNVRHPWLVKIDESNESWVEVYRRLSKVQSSPVQSSPVQSSPVCAKLSMEIMGVECNLHRCLDRDVRYFDEQAAVQRQFPGLLTGSSGSRKVSRSVLA